MAEAGGDQWDAQGVAGEGGEDEESSVSMQSIGSLFFS